MKIFFIAVLSFVFVVQINGQGYVGRVRKPKHKAVLAARHDPLALDGGKRIAQQVLSQAAHTIDAGSHGAVSRGDIFAHQAVEGLAREMVHVAGKKLGVGPNDGHILPIQPVHKPIHPIHPKPIHPKPIHPKPIHPKPIHPKPIHPKPIHPKPIHHSPVHKPILPKPIYPGQIHPKPVNPVHHPKPVLPVHKPIHHPKPVVPVHKPVHHPKPVMPVHKPVIHPKPVVPVHKPVIHPKPVIPVHQPILPKPIKPIHPKPVLPIHPKPIHPKPIHPKPVLPKPVVGPVLGGGLGHLQGGHRGPLPLWVRRLIGSTISGRPIIGGQDGFPRHGGAGAGEPFKTGLRNGWGGDPNAPVHVAVSSWEDPLQGNLFPTDYSGGDLIFDDDAGHYIMKSQASAGGVVPVGPGISPVGPAIGHQVAKATGGIAPIDPVGQTIHNIHKSVSPVGAGVVGAGIVGPVAPIDPVGQTIHNIHKSVAPVGAGVIGAGIVGPAVLPGVDPVHDMVKAGSHVGLSSLSGLGKPLGGTPIHNVHKVAKSGIVAANHDPLAVDIGHQTAKHIANKATHTINQATGGGVARGDPFATSAAHGLAREAAAVTNAELALASGAAGSIGGPLGGVVGGVAGIQPGLSIYGGLPAKPVIPKKKPVHHVPAFPTGYGGRTRKRKVIPAKTW